MKKMTLSALIVIATSTAALAQDTAAGKTSFNKCAACHAIGEGAKNKVGPELNGLKGRKSGTAEGYSYSEANKNSGITWDEATFKDYIKAPRPRFRAPKWCSPESRTNRKPATSGRSLRNTTRTARRSNAGSRSLVMRGLDPRIHHTSQESFEGDGWPGQARP
jgi:cytochrome c